MYGFETLDNNTGTLAHRLAVGPMPAREALRCALQIGEALHAIHRNGGVSGCMCPATIRLDDHSARLIAAHGGADAATSYCAPEVLAGQPPDALSDIFSFGAVVYEIVTGRRAFEGSDRSLLPESSGGALDRLVAGCLALDPRMRQQSVRRVVIGLRLLHVEAGRLEAAARARARAARPARSVQVWRRPRAGFYRLVAGSITCIQEWRPNLAAEILIVLAALTAGIVWGAGLASPKNQTPRMTGSVRSPHPDTSLHASPSAIVIPVVKRDPDGGANAPCSISPTLSRTPAIALQLSSTETIKEIVAAIAAYESLPPQLLHSVIKVESNYNPNVVSTRGAQGLMQLVPLTAQKFGVNNVFSPVENIQGGAKYLRHLLNLYNGDYVKTLAAYNAGEGAVAKFGGVPPYAETRNYLTEVRKQLEESLAAPSEPGTGVTPAAFTLEPVNTDNGGNLQRRPF